MSYDLLRSAKHIRGLSNAEFRVLFYLLEAANSATHACYPSIKRIAQFTDMAERTVQRHISALADRGLFERIEQRRSDGSRAVNCYRFVAAGTIQIGRESVVQLSAEEMDDFDAQPAISGRLTNPPFQTGGGVNPDTTPRQSRRDIDKESEPGIGTSPPTPDGVAPPEDDLFAGELPVVEQEPLERFVARNWEALAAQHPGVARVPVIDPGLAHTIGLRAKQHAQPGETPEQVWERVFAVIRGSSFLQGREPPGQGRTKPFRLTLAWAAGANNFRKIVGGQYDGRTDNRVADPETGRRRGPTEQALGDAIAIGRARRAARRSGGDPGSPDGAGARGVASGAGIGR